jgi:hypothetical protein
VVLPFEHAHDHAPTAVATCEADRVHLADHPDAPDLSLHATCPICDFRIQPFLAADLPPIHWAALHASHLHPIDHSVGRMRLCLRYGRGPPASRT